MVVCPHPRRTSHDVLPTPLVCVCMSVVGSVHVCVWHQSAHFLWQHLQHLQFVLACEHCPVVTSKMGFLVGSCFCHIRMEAELHRSERLVQAARGCWLLLLSALDWHDPYCNSRPLHG